MWCWVDPDYDGVNHEYFVVKATEPEYVGKFRALCSDLREDVIEQEPEKEKEEELPPTDDIPETSDETVSGPNDEGEVKKECYWAGKPTAAGICMAEKCFG